jgi:hypothetical protein
MSSAIQGHNNPPSVIIDIDDATAAARLEAADLVQRRDDLSAAFTRWMTTTSGLVIDEIVQGKSADFVKQIGLHLKLTEDRRKATKQPVLDLAKSVDGVFAMISDPLTEAKAAVERAMTTYAQKKAREEQDRIRQKAEEMARHAREAAEMAAMEAELAGEDAPVPDVIQAPEIAVPTTAEASRSHGDYGTTASLRGRWTYEVADTAMIPRHLLMVNDAAVKAAIKAGERNIPGLRIFQETKIGIR